MEDKASNSKGEPSNQCEIFKPAQNQGAFTEFEWLIGNLKIISNANRCANIIHRVSKYQLKRTDCLASINNIIQL